MKNKKIEELLNDMRHSYEIHEEIIKKYNNADKISYPYTINLKQIDLLLSYIEQLEQCYCNRTDCSSRIKDSKKYDSLLQKYKQLENNRDKALKIIDSYELGKYDYSIPPGGIIELREALTNETNKRNVN